MNEIPGTSLVDRARLAAPTVVAMQGAAALLFALAEIARLFDPRWLTWLQPLQGLVESSNLAFAVLLATEGFTVAALLAEQRPMRQVVLRVVGYIAAIWLLLALVCAAVAVLRQFDSTDDQPWENIQTATARTLTFSMNSWAAHNPFALPGDLAMIWYFSVVAQLAAVLTVVGLALRRWPRFLGTILLLAAVAAAVYRGYAVETDGWFAVALDTAVRADAFLVGAAAVFLLRPLSPRTGAGLVGGAVLVIAGLVVASGFLDADQILTYQLPTAAAAMALLLVGARSSSDERALSVRIATSGDTVTVAHVWRDLVAWSPLVVLTTQRHLFDEPYVAGTWTAIIVLAVVATISRAVIDGLVDALVIRSARLGRRGRRTWRPVSGSQASSEDRGARREPPPEG